MHPFWDATKQKWLESARTSDFYCSNSFWWANPAGDNLHVHVRGSSEPSSSTPLFPPAFPNYCFSLWLNHQINFSILDTSRKLQLLQHMWNMSHLEDSGLQLLPKAGLCCTKQGLLEVIWGELQCWELFIPLWSPAFNPFFSMSLPQRTTNNLQLKTNKSPAI